MALFTFNADNTTATGMTKNGTDWVLDGTSGQIDFSQDFGAGFAADFSTSTETLAGGVGALVEGDAGSSISASGFDITITTTTSLKMTGGTGTMSGVPYATGKAFTGDFDITLSGDRGQNNMSPCLGIRVDDTTYAVIYTYNTELRFGIWDSGTRVYRSGASTLSVAYGYYRLTRAGNLFTAYYREDQEDAWSSIGSRTQAISTNCISTVAADYVAGSDTVVLSFDSTSGIAPPTATYQTTDDAGATNYVPATPENISALQSRANTDLQTTAFRIFIDGDAGAKWSEFTIENQSPDVTPPGVPTISNLESVGSDPNLGFFSDWTEPTDTDFDHVKGQLNIDSGGWLDIDNTASLGGATSMKFNESLAGTQAQAEGWLYQNHYARNGYTEGTTAQTRFRSVDNLGNESSYSTSGIITLTEGTTAPGKPTVTAYTAGSGQETLTISAALESDIIYAVFRRANLEDWTEQSDTFKRKGSGDILITGLIDGETYEFITYADNGSCPSVWSKPVFDIPRLIGQSVQSEQMVDSAALAMLQAIKGSGFGKLLSFQNKGYDAVTVWGVESASRSDGVDPNGGGTGISTISYDIPKQTNFPPSEIFPGSTITDLETCKVFLVADNNYARTNSLDSPYLSIDCRIFDSQCYGG